MPQRAGGTNRYAEIYVNQCTLVSQEKIADAHALGDDIRLTRSDVAPGHPDYYQVSSVCLLPRFRSFLLSACRFRLFGFCSSTCRTKKQTDAQTRLPQGFVQPA